MIDETLVEAAEKMDKAVEVAKEDFATIRTGRANPALFTKVMVDYYGSPTPLQQLASFADPGRPHAPDHPVRQGGAERYREGPARIRGRSQPVQRRQGHPRGHCPELTQERRKEYVKIVRGKGEDAKVSIRNIRRKAKDTIGQAGQGRRRRRRRGQPGRKGTGRHDQVAHVDTIDELLKRKEAELLEV